MIMGLMVTPNHFIDLGVSNNHTIEASVDGLLGLQFLSRVLDSPLEKARELFSTRWQFIPGDSLSQLILHNPYERMAPTCRRPSDWTFVMWDRQRLETWGFSKTTLSEWYL